MTSTDELERLIKSASELPWKEGLRDGDEKDVWGPGYLVAKVYLGSPAAKRRANNAALIVAAVNALPELLAERERLRQAYSARASTNALNFRFGKNEHGPLLTFIEAENADGYSIEVGEWSDDGEYRILTIPNPYTLLARVREIEKCARYVDDALTVGEKSERLGELLRLCRASAALTGGTP